MTAKTLHIAICDDEPIMLENVREKCKVFLQKKNIPHKILCYSSGYTLIEETIAFDLVLLDIEMPEINGFDVAKILKEKNKQLEVIILTSHTELMSVGYIVSAFRYLTKPIDEKNFYEALDSFIEQKLTRNIISVNSKITLDEKEIVYIEALGDTTAVTTFHDSHVSYYSLKTFMEMLDEQAFISTHRAYIVHFKYVKEVLKNEVLLVNGKVIPLARRKRTEVSEKFTRYTIDNARYIGGI